MVTGAELIMLLQDADVRQSVKSVLGLPSEAVAEALEKLAAAQTRTDATVKELAVEVKELAVEVKELAVEVKELAAAQAQTDATIKELAAAQAQTDATVKELAAAQGRTDATVKELAAAQGRTDATVKELVLMYGRLEQGQKELQVGQKELRQTVGALSDNVGFGLEELASIVLPGVLAKEAGVTVKGGFVRRFVQTKLGEEELDLFSEGDRGGEAVAIVGEVKSRIYEADARRFAAKAARVAEALEATLGPLPLVSILFGFVVHPSAQQAAKDLDLLLVASRPG